ncbi:mannitol dehydrogenase family protein [Amylibacter marinus]|uniref:mannitol dehydrogenase family protein n=1 Tax=Amylibacter marinus TaxID=1475483 RepID=UPI0024E0D784|nr:mannitol dehydrogenase family protein [Amylibacter marinus]
MRENSPLTSPPTERPKAGILHFGPGAFFRAFNAIYTAEAMAHSGGNWGIRAVSLRSAGIRDTLAAQHYIYTAAMLMPDGIEYTQVDVIDSILVAPENPQAVLAALCEANIRIVSLTITEKGYCFDPATNGLDHNNPDIMHDLDHPETPRTAIGFLVYGLAQRRAAGLPPFTVLSCDNLPSNGALVRRMVLELAHAVDPSLADWIGAEARFPSTMVDRITPATTARDIENLRQAIGIDDSGCVVHEPFRQWVIEDDFVKDDHPNWAAAGAQMVTSVDAFELMKLRCLNGSHSTLAYLGYLAGYKTIAAAMCDTRFADLLTRLWAREIIPTIPTPEGEDLHAYCHALQERYKNPSIHHKTSQIAMDGSQKLPQRLLGAISDNLKMGNSAPLLCLAVAGWMRYVGGTDELGQEIDVQDPMAQQLRNAVIKSTRPEEAVQALLGIEAIFDPELAQNPKFEASVTTAYISLLEHGTLKTIERELYA